MLTTIALSVIISLVITLSISYLIIRMFQNVVVSMGKKILELQEEVDKLKNG